MGNSDFACRPSGHRQSCARSAVAGVFSILACCVTCSNNLYLLEGQLSAASSASSSLLFARVDGELVADTQKHDSGHAETAGVGQAPTRPMPRSGRRFLVQEASTRLSARRESGDGSWSRSDVPRARARQWQASRTFRAPLAEFFLKAFLQAREHALCKATAFSRGARQSETWLARRTAGRHWRAKSL